MAVERVSGGSSLIDVLDRILDKGIVIDAWIRVSLVGIDLITVEARVVVASIDTYLRYADALGLSHRQATGTLGAGAGSVDSATSRARTTQERYAGSRKSCETAPSSSVTRPPAVTRAKRSNRCSTTSCA